MWPCSYSSTSSPQPTTNWSNYDAVCVSRTVLTFWPARETFSPPQSVSLTAAASLTVDCYGHYRRSQLFLLLKSDAEYFLRK